MAKNSLIKNYSFNALYRMLDLVVPLVTTPYLSRVFGDYGIGVFSYTNAIAAAFTMVASAGINIYGQREIAFFQTNKEKRSQIFWEVALFKIGLTLAFGGIYWFLFSKSREYGLLFRILVITIVANAVDISWYFQGMEEFQKTAIKNMAFRLVGALGIFVFVHNADDLPLYASLYAVPILAGNLSLWPYLKSEIAKPEQNKLRILRHIKPVFALFIPQIAIELYTVVDKIMLGELASCIEEVSYYEQAQKIVKIGLRFLTAFGAVMLSRTASEYSEHGGASLDKNILASFQFTLLLGVPMTLGIAGIASSLVPWFLGPDFLPVTDLIIATSPIIMIIGCSNIIGTQYLIPTRQDKQYTISVLCGAGINLVMNFFLIPVLGAWGATAASVAAESVVAFIQIMLTRQRVHVLTYVRQGWRCFVSGAVMIIIVCSVRLLVMNNFFCTMIQIVAGVFSYFLCLYLLKDRAIENLLR